MKNETEWQRFKTRCDKWSREWALISEMAYLITESITDALRREEE